MYIGWFGPWSCRGSGRRPLQEEAVDVFVMMVASECAPVAHAGGLGDVVFGLSRELELRGNAVEIVLPKYDCLRYDRIYGLTVVYHDLWVPWYSGSVHCTVYFGFDRWPEVLLHRAALAGRLL